MLMIKTGYDLCYVILCYVMLCYVGCRLRIAELERTRTQQRLSSLKDKISELESDNKSMTEELDRLRQMNMKVEGLKTTIKNKDMAMKQFKDEIDLVTGQYEDLKEKMDEKRVDTERQIRYFIGCCRYLDNNLFE